MGFFDTLTENTNLDQSFMKGRDYRVMLAQHEFEKGLRQQQMDLANKELALKQQEQQFQIDAINEKTKQMAFVNKTYNDIMNRLEATSQDKKVKGAKSAKELPAPTATDLRGASYSKALPVSVAPITTQEDRLGLLLQAGRIGANDLADVLGKEYQRNLPMTPMEQRAYDYQGSQITENNANTAALNARADWYKQQKIDKESAAKQLENEGISAPVAARMINDYYDYVNNFDMALGEPATWDEYVDMMKKAMKKGNVPMSGGTDYSSRYEIK